MPSHDNSHDTDATRDLLNDAMRTCEHARLTLELVAKQVALAEFRPPTDYQVAGTGRVVAEFSRATITKYLELVRSIDASIVISPTDINVSYIDNELIAAALARVDEHLITQILRSKADGTLSPLAPIVDSEEAELIFAMLHAANRRVNAQGEPLIVEEDVDYRVLERLIWRIAAETRSVLERGLLELDEIDEILTTAAKRFLGRYRRRNLTRGRMPARAVAALFRGPVRLREGNGILDRFPTLPRIVGSLPFGFFDLLFLRRHRWHERSFQFFHLIGRKIKAALLE